jgi:hypothetical protein
MEDELGVSRKQQPLRFTKSEWALSWFTAMMDKKTSKWCQGKQRSLRFGESKTSPMSEGNISLVTQFESGHHHGLPQ